MGTKRGPKPGLVEAYAPQVDLPSSTEVARPSYLPEKAHPFWDFLTERLCEFGILHEIDSIALAMLCNEMAKYWECQERIDEEGLVQSGEKTGDVKSAWVRVQESAFDRVVPLFSKFGLSPLSRKKFDLAINSAKNQATNKPSLRIV